MRSFGRQPRWFAAWLMALLLLAQWLTAAYACPTLDAATSGEAVMAAMPGCTGMPVHDADQPQRCKAHCEMGQQSVNSGAVVPDLPPALTEGAAVVGRIDAADAAQLAAAMPAALAAGPPAGSPPIYLSLHVLRN